MPAAGRDDVKPDLVLIYQKPDGHTLRLVRIGSDRIELVGVACIDLLAAGFTLAPFTNRTDDFLSTETQLHAFYV